MDEEFSAMKVIEGKDTESVSLTEVEIDIIDIALGIAEFESQMHEDWGKVIGDKLQAAKEKLWERKYFGGEQ